MTSERARRLADGGTRAEASELTDSYDERCGISQSVAGRRLAGHGAPPKPAIALSPVRGRIKATRW